MLHVLNYDAIDDHSAFRERITAAYACCFVFVCLHGAQSHLAYLYFNAGASDHRPVGVSTAKGESRGLCGAVGVREGCGQRRVPLASHRMRFFVDIQTMHREILSRASHSDGHCVAGTSYPGQG